MKKALVVGLTCSMVISLSACGGGKQEAEKSAGGSDNVSQTTQAASEKEQALSEADSGETELEVYMSAGSALELLDDATRSIIDQFTEETGIKVSYNVPGEGYEELMKARMASNDMPDVFCTHGWAVVRYGEYLLSLNEEPWANDVSDSIREIITDDNGNLLVLPSAYALFGINCNFDVLEEAGVNADEIKTWKDFEDACEKVRAIGKDPILVGGKDLVLPAQIFQDLCPSVLTEEDDAAIQDGSFDWEKIRPISERYVDWVDRGFFNVDCLTADFAAVCQSLAAGEGAFIFLDSSIVNQGLAYYPDANMGMIPVPAENIEDGQIGIAGEYLSWGIWKDSENVDAAKQLLEYFARPENAKILAEAAGLPSGLENVDYDLGKLTSEFQKITQCRTKPVWDRKLPSGMFNDLCTAAQSILAKEDDAVSKGIEILRQSYNEKMK